MGLDAAGDLPSRKINAEVHRGPRRHDGSLRRGPPHLPS